MDMRELIDTLNNATKAYDLGKPIMEDKQWDDLYFSLEKKEQESGICYPDSPTQRVNYEIVSKLNKVTHSHPMLSLSKTKEINSIISIFKNKWTLIMSKLDGLTCSLYYEDGELKRAETRGNGEIGEDITHNAKIIKNIPQTISYKKPVTIDGEVLCTWNNFQPFSDEYKNPRNFAAGSIRLLDSKECAERNLSFVVWDVITDLASTLYSKLAWAAEQGFEVVPHILVSDVEAEGQNAIERIQSNKTYPIDGVVFKINDCAEYAAAGRTAHHFNGGIAYKFYDEIYETSLLNIEWSPGRTGVLTPVACFETVDIEGSSVERASLHNISVLVDTLHGYGYKGQKVGVSKMNLIIPQIMWAEDTKDDDEEEFTVPNCCPICGGRTEIITSDSNVQQLYCTNLDCQGKIINKLEHLFGKKGLDIKGLSKKTFEKLLDWGWINSLSDVFILNTHREEWIKKAGFGIKSVDTILNSINAGKTTELVQFISGIGIPLVGTTYAKVIAKKCPTWEDFRLMVKNKEPFYNWEGFGGEIHKAIMNFDYSEADYIYENYLKDTMSNSLFGKTSNNNLQDFNIVITGKLKVYKNRDSLQKDIEANGGKVVGSVSSKTNYLINNDPESTSSKNTTAKKLGIPIITEENFIKKFLT